MEEVIVSTRQLALNYTMSTSLTKRMLKKEKAKP